MTDGSSKNSALATPLMRIALTVIATLFISAVNNSAHADNKKPASSKDGKYFDASGDPTGALPRDRPPSHEPEPKSAQDAENTCMGPG